MMYYYIGQCNFILRLMISYCPIWFYIAPSEITLSLINKYASYHCYWAIWPYMASFEIRIRLIISSYPICFYIAFCEIILFFLFNIDDDDDDDDDNDYDQRGFCGMVDQRKTFSLIFSLDHCRQRFSQSWISDKPRAGFELVQNLSSGFVEWSCAVVIPTSRHYYYHNCHYYRVALSYVTSYGLTLDLIILYSPIWIYISCCEIILHAMT